MYDKELFEKICRVDCSKEELKAFVHNIEEREFDLDNAFDKYYSLDRILLAIQRYANKEIDKEYLADWAYAYCWILMCGFTLKRCRERITFKVWIQDLIAECLDGLSFFDGSDYYDLAEIKEIHQALDRIYSNLTEWACIAAPTEEEDDSVVILAYNSKTREFIKLYGEIHCFPEKVDFECVRLEALENKVVALCASDYKEIKYRSYEKE